MEIHKKHDGLQAFVDAFLMELRIKCKAKVFEEILSELTLS